MLDTSPAQDARPAERRRSGRSAAERSRARRASRRWAAVAAALFVLLAACGDDSGDGSADTTVAVDSGDDGGGAVDPASVPVLSAQDVCDLAPSADVAAAIEGEVDEVAAGSAPTPQCVYNVTIDEQRRSLTTSVQRPEDDLGGKAGAAGFDVATDVVVFETPYEPFAGVGDRAAVSASDSLTILVVLAGDQVFTVGGAGFTVEQIAAVATVVADAIA